VTSFLGLVNQAQRGISQKRWSSDEPAAGLTWGSLMTGDSLFVQGDVDIRTTSSRFNVVICSSTL
jgi:hypothetical protein